MAKQLKFSQDAREAAKRGVQKIARAVKRTMGPRGQSVLIDRGWGSPSITTDGAGVAEEVDLLDPFENMGAQMVKEAATKTGDEAGDGTTTAVVLAEAIYLEGLRRVAAGADAMAVHRGIRKAADAAVAGLQKQSKPVQGRADIERIALNACKGDADLARTLADTFDKVGKEGVVTIEEGKGIDTEVRVVEGMQFDRGFLSPQFVNKKDLVRCELESPFVLIHEDKLSSVATLIPLLEKVSAAKRPLLLIAEDVEGEALATLVVNHLRGTVEVCAVKAPGYGDRRKEMLQDVAVLTGAKPLFKDLGFDLKTVGLESLGRARKAIVDSENTTITGGAGRRPEIEARIAQIQAEIEKTDSDYDREKLQERLAKLAGGVAEIRVGAATETEMKSKKQKVDDALHAVQAALKEGFVPGGGVALLRAGDGVRGLRLSGDEAYGAEIVAAACARPLRQIADNSGAEGGAVVAEVRAGKGAWGFDARTRECKDLLKAGVVDPTRVARLALANAASVAGLLLTTEAMVSDIPSEEPEEQEGHQHAHM